MADIVRILGLDDDNHAPIFRMETGEILDTPRELIEFLSHSHDVEYQVKMFTIVGNYSGTLAMYDQDDIDDWFYFLEDVSRYEDADFGLIFDLFWESVNQQHW
jgi:hypothetical protein